MVVFRAISISLMFFVSGCSDSSDLCSYDEVKRVASPDNVVDAILLAKNCGATVSNGYRVYLDRKGETPEMNDKLSVFVSDKTDSIDISWVENQSLHISYSEARIFHFKNFWQSKELDNFNYIVKISELEM